MRKILVVEDEDLLRETYRDILSSAPYDVHVANNGKEALKKCSVNNYDLILLDLMMPTMNGVEFMQAYIEKGMNPTKVLVLSNISFGDDLRKVKDLGAHKNMIKSDLSPKQLLAAVRSEVSPG
jgi:DNA-binding response OmpR family regulator